MKKLVALLVMGAVCALAITALAGAASKATWTAALTSRQEVPKQVVKAPLAHGLFKGDAQRQQTQLEANLLPSDRACAIPPPTLIWEPRAQRATSLSPCAAGHRRARAA